jgi:DNA-binding NarL/FixJ family response regulator
MAIAPSILPALHFVGRSAELGFLVDRAKEASAGCGSTVLVSGEAGIGKSRVVGELRKILEPKRARIGIGTCLEYLRVPYLPLVEAFRSLAGDQGDRRRASGQLQRWLEDVGSQVGSLAPPVDDQQKYRRFIAALKALTALAKTLPTIVAIEDIQWADDATVEFLDFLTRNIRETRLLLIVTYRREAESTSVQVAHTVERLHRSGAVTLIVPSLTLGETRELAFRTLRLRSDSDPLIVDRIYQLSEGNPLYVEELLRGVSEGSFGSESGAPFVPSTIQAAVQERLNQFAPHERDVLTLAAVIGLRFRSDLVARLARESPVAVSAVLHKARMSQLVLGDATEADVYRFRHTLIRETLYEQRPASDRRQLHARIAEELESEPDVVSRLGKLAYHWSAACVSDKAVHYNEQAGDAAMRLYAYPDAARCYQQAIGMLSQAGLRRATILEKLAYALSVGGFGEHARIWFERALDEYRELHATEKMVGMLLNISAQCWVNAETETAINMCTRALDVASFLPTSSLQFNARVMLATYCALRGRGHEALEHLKKAERVECSREPGYESRFFDVRGISLDIVGDAAGAQASFEWALALATQTKDRDLLTRVCSNYADFAISTGNLDQARRCWELGLAEAAQSEYVWHTAFLALSFAWTQFLAGDFSEACRLCEYGLSRGEESTLVRILAATVGIPLGLILEEETLTRRCADEEAVEFAFKSGEAQHIGGVVAAFAQLFVARGQIEKARALLHRGLIALPNADQAEIMLVDIAMHGETSDVEPARKLLDDWSRTPQHLTAQAFLLLFDAHVASRSGRLRTVSSGALRAASLLQELGIQYYQARALELASRQNEALEIYQRICAKHDCERLQRGQTSDMVAQRPAELLTMRELEIAKLAATGMTNRSIADKLSISKRTVDHHVNTILTRAGLRSRVQLSEFLRSHGISAETQ